MNQEILKEIKEIKKALQVIASSLERKDIRLIVGDFEFITRNDGCLSLNQKRD